MNRKETKKDLIDKFSYTENRKDRELKDRPKKMRRGEVIKKI